MTDRDCEWLRAVADELALGVLPGQERAEAIAHLDRCPACRERVEHLTFVGDGLLSLLPGSEPPAGFETRVTDRLGLNRPARRWRPRAGVAVAAAVATALGFGFGGWAVGTAIEGASAPPRGVRSPRLGARPARGVSAGPRPPPGGPDLRLYRTSGLGLHVGPPRPGRFRIRLPGRRRVRGRGLARRIPGGRKGRMPTGAYGRHIGPPRGVLLDDAGRGYWGAPTRVDPATVSGARLLAADGSVLATARFDAGHNQ